MPPPAVKYVRVCRLRPPRITGDNKRPRCCFRVEQAVMPDPRLKQQLLYRIRSCMLFARSQVAVLYCSQAWVPEPVVLITGPQQVNHERYSSCEASVRKGLIKPLVYFKWRSLRTVPRQLLHELRRKQKRGLSAEVRVQLGLDLVRTKGVAALPSSSTPTGRSSNWRRTGRQRRGTSAPAPPPGSPVSK